MKTKAIEYISCLQYTPLSDEHNGSMNTSEYLVNNDKLLEAALVYMLEVLALTLRAGDR